MKKIKNIDSVEHVWLGQVFEPDYTHEIPTVDLMTWANNDIVIAAISNGIAQMIDGASNIVGVSNQIDFLKDDMRNVTITSLPSMGSFTSKTIKTGGVTKSLFRRVTGIKSSLSIGENTILFTVPYAWVKVTGAQMIGGEIGDTSNFMVLDSTAGTYTGVPNYQLNQFGFNVNIAKDFFESRSQFDADLYVGMQIKLVYTSISAKTIGINFILDEVK